MENDFKSLEKKRKGFEKFSDSNKKKKIFAIIPVYNEEKYLKEVIEKTKKYVDEIIVVDDASSDLSSKIAKENGARVIRHVVNLGLGASLKTGCDAALKLGADIIITLDGDGQHDPDEIPKLLKKFNEEKLDIVFGERCFDENMPFVKKTGNKFFDKFSKKLFNTKLKDTQTGFRVFSSETYKKIRWESSDYAVASEILINIERKKLNYGSEKIKTIYHDNHKGTTIIDGIKIANKMLNLKFNKK